MRASVMFSSLQHYGMYPPGSSVHGILQVRILEWVGMSSSRGSSRPRDQICVSYVSYTSTEPPGKPVNTYNSLEHWQRLQGNNISLKGQSGPVMMTHRPHMK